MRKKNSISRFYSSFFLSSHFGLLLEFANTISSQLLKYRKNKNKKVNDFLDQKWLFTSLSFKVSLELSLKAEAYLNLLAKYSAGCLIKHSSEQ